MIRTMLCAQGHQLRADIAQAEIGQLLADEQNVLWLDLENPTPEELQRLGSEFGFHPLALEDVSKGHRAKIDQYEDFMFIVFYDIDYQQETGLIDEHELDIFLGKNFLVTVHEEAIEEIEEVAVRWQRNAAQIERGVGVLLYSLLDTIVDHYFPVVDQIGERIDEIETNIFSGVDREGLQAIFLLRRELLTLRRRVTPERDIIAMLARRDLPVAGEAVVMYFQDIYDHVLRVAEAIDTYRELLGGVLDSYLSVNANNMALAANNLNMVMKTLTSYSIILMSMTMIAGIYGMNFENMPELRTRYGYFVVLGLLLLLGVGQARFFKRKGWL